MKKYYAYLRINAESQINPAKLSTQEETLRKFARKNGFIIEKVCKEYGSANAKHRPVFEEMMEEIKVRKIKNIICSSIDRLTRDYRVWTKIKALFKQKRVEVVTPAQPYSTDLNKILFAYAGEARKLHSEAIKRGIRAKKLAAQKKDGV